MKNPREWTISAPSTAGGDLIPSLRDALTWLNPAGGGRLRLPAGVHHLWPESAPEEFFSIVNHDAGPRYVGIDLHGLRDVEIIGDNTTLIVHDCLIPLRATDCTGLTIRGLRIDWARPFYGQGEVLSGEAGEVVAKLGAELPWSVINGKLMFWGEGWSAALEHVLEFDAVTGGPARGAQDNFGAGWFLQYLAEDLGEGRVRLRGAFTHVPKAGNQLVFRPGERRDAPAVVLRDCRDVRIEDIVIHHAGGMGVIAHRCDNVALRRVRVEPSPGRFFSTAVDATHFAACRGEIIIEDCDFSRQLDDPANIHGIYVQVVRMLDAHTMRVRLVHPQQQGIAFAAPGERLGLVRGATLADYWNAPVRAVRPVNRSWIDLEFTEALPADVVPGDAVDNLDWHPRVTIRRCRMGRNRARGPLLGTRAGALIEDNVFQTPGAALQCAPDARFWFESAPICGLIIRRNRFLACAHEAAWGDAPITLAPEVDDASVTEALIRDVLIEDNVFETVDGACVRARHVAGLVIRNNRIVPLGVVTRQEYDLVNCPDAVLC